MYVATKHSAVWMGIWLDIFDRLTVYVYGLPLFCCCLFDICADVGLILYIWQRRITWYVDKSTRRQMNLRVNCA